MTETGRRAPSSTAALDRGSFSDGVRTFNVRASSAEAPDSFQVFADAARRDLVLVVTGLVSHELRASWGAEWRTASDAWREWLEASAFMVFYNGHRPAVGRVRVCNG